MIAIIAMPGDTSKLCVNCSSRLSKRGTGDLCYHCIQHNLTKLRPLPPYGTTALPGTTAKIEILKWRHENGYSLWHPEDMTWEELLGTKRGDSNGH